MKSRIIIFAYALLASSLTYALSSETAQKTAKGTASAGGNGPAKEEKAPPLPLLTLDGVGGVLLTSIAYPLNPGPKGTKIGVPSIGFTYVNARHKNVESFGVAETLFGKLEIGYNASRFGTGTLQRDILAYASTAISRNDVWLHTVNVRYNILSENSFDTSYLPAVTLGVHGKFNDGISDTNDDLGGLLDTIGYDREYGVEFTVTATKAFPIYGHPLILSITARASDASNLGYTGYSGDYQFSLEGNAVFGITDWLFLAFEYRQKRNQYDSVVAGGHTLVGKETDWWTIGLAAILSSHTTVTVGYGHLGTVLNTKENGAWALAAKYEF